MHGHTFAVRVVLQGPVDPHLGWVLDFADVQAIWAPVHAALDHRVLNEVAGLENPTSERLAVWLWRALDGPVRALGPSLVSVTISETGGFQVTYRGG